MIIASNMEEIGSASDSAEESRALGKGWPGFWPIDVTDHNGKSVAWTDGAHAFFLNFRDKLRQV